MISVFLIGLPACDLAVDEMPTAVSEPELEKLRLEGAERFDRSQLAEDLSDRVLDLAAA